MTKSTIFLAVHGIGDQVRNETVQAVASHRVMMARWGIQPEPPGEA